MALLGIHTPEDLRHVDRAAVITWKRHLEASGTASATVRWRLAALSSLSARLVDRQVFRDNPPAARSAGHQTARVTQGDR
jgi:site-specific recombinase XerC